jgi:hypothetical protein
VTTGLAALPLARSHVLGPLISDEAILKVRSIAYAAARIVDMFDHHKDAR